MRKQVLPKRAPERAGAGSDSVSPARRAAFAVLIEVGAGRGHSDELLHSSLLSGLSGPDTNLATALVMGVLRWQIALDIRLKTMFARPDQRVADEVWVALRMGAFQLSHMDRIPAHAALSESVALCRAAGQEHAAGMVNAVLRRWTREPMPGTKLYESTANFAERLAHPAWMAERWASRYGRAAALAICEAGQREPDGSSSIFTDDRDDHVVSEAPSAEDAVGAEVAPTSRKGELPVMDDGSRLVAEIAAAAFREVAGEAPARLWDCCAAPGGKTAILALRLPQTEILATDVSANRLRSMEQRLGGMAASAGDGGFVRCLVADAATLQPEEGLFDLVLADVPCSGTGTLARNPEIRHQLSIGDLARQAQRQRVILAAAMQRVRPGGRLVYSTCSLEPEECETIVEGVAKQWSRVDPAGLLEILQARGILKSEVDGQSIIRDHALRTLPGVHPVDGFYAVVLERPLDVSA